MASYMARCGVRRCKCNGGVLFACLFVGSVRDEICEGTIKKELLRA
jgi:hypothetical protein